MQRKIYLLFLFCAMATAAQAQVDTLVVQDTTVNDTVVFPETLIDTIDQPEVDTAWKFGGNIGLQFSQAAYSNWRAGGVNSIAGNSLLSLFADYDNGGLWKWVNHLGLAYGMNFQDDIYNKTDDRIELESRVDRTLNKRWNLSGILNFRTQFTNGYAQPGDVGDSVRVSTFMAPGYLVTGVGFTYKPNKRFSAFLSPVSSKMTFVNDERLANEGSFGVEPGSMFRQEIGGYVNINYKVKLMKNIEMQNRLNLYSNYLNNNYKYIDVNGETLLFLKVNKYITANVALNIIYDHDIKFDVDDDGVEEGPRTQLKEVIGVGLVYAFGDEPLGGD